MGKIRYCCRGSGNSPGIMDMTPQFVLNTLLLGDYNVGKTSIIHLLTGMKKCPKLVERYCPLSVSVQLNRKGKHVLLKITDTGGQEKFRSLTASYYRGAHGCLVLFDVTKESTFNNLTYWLHDLKEYSTHPEISTILVGTKCHVTPDEREVSYDRAQKFAESVGLPYMEVSAEEGKNVTEVFERLADIIIENLTKDSTPNMQQPNRVILSEQQKQKKQWCSC
ncbi:uncharacterized protein LOC123534810 isoform X1 [Mercenaria mercenaria]|uniref:uncharacterized protein LOC123534810 isoform X1 n=1 Tax=Mercenaria mercenaria TaxID=6596 RepID=UPI00234F7E23|nr:uncharacterized protein LOC123534810 isoform X1 [Mercenaria mercenaria]